MIEIDGLEIGGCGDLARRWGVSTQRVRNLAALADFPASLGTVNGQPAYNLVACDSWRSARPRHAGRPRRRVPTTADIDAVLKS